jgi:hypothetical protein
MHKETVLHGASVSVADFSDISTFTIDTGDLPDGGTVLGH